MKGYIKCNWWKRMVQSSNTKKIVTKRQGQVVSKQIQLFEISGGKYVLIQKYKISQ